MNHLFAVQLMKVKHTVNKSMPYNPFCYELSICCPADVSKKHCERDSCPVTGLVMNYLFAVQLMKVKNIVKETDAL